MLTYVLVFSWVTSIITGSCNFLIGNDYILWYIYIYIYVVDEIGDVGFLLSSVFCIKILLVIFVRIFNTVCSEK